MSKNKYKPTGTYQPVPSKPGFQAGAARYNLEKAARGKGIGGAVGGAMSYAKLHPGKTGAALAGLAAAGGLGIAGMKALGARKKRQANSLQGRLSSASKMFR